MQGIIQHSIIHDKEEGEILHCLSREQIAELFKLNPDEVEVEEGQIHDEQQDLSEDSELEDVDDVEIEDIPTVEKPKYNEEIEIEDLTAEEYPEFVSKDNNIPSFNDLFADLEEEELTRKESEKVQQTEEPDVSQDEAAELEALKQEWLTTYREILKKYAPAPPIKYQKLYKSRGRVAKGHIISWAYFDDLKCYGVKREFGVQYFKHPHDFKTLPSFDMHQLARRKLLYSESSGMASWFERQLTYESRKKWVNFKP